jgi:hypothetical protein
MQIQNSEIIILYSPIVSSLMEEATTAFLYLPERVWP